MVNLNLQRGSWVQDSWMQWTIYMTTLHETVIGSLSKGRKILRTKRDRNLLGSIYPYPERIWLIEEKFICILKREITITEFGRKIKWTHTAHIHINTHVHICLCIYKCIYVGIHVVNIWGNLPASIKKNIGINGVCTYTYIHISDTHLQTSR